MQFEHFVTFASGVGYPRATGYFICEQVANERYRRGDTHEHPSPFLLRHNTNANILDEDLVYQLLDIIAQHAEAEVKWDRLKTEKAVQGRVKPAAETVTLLRWPFASTPGWAAGICSVCAAKCRRWCGSAASMR